MANLDPNSYVLPINNFTTHHVQDISGLTMKMQPNFFLPLS